MLANSLASLPKQIIECHFFFREMLVFDGDKNGSKAQLELFADTLNVIRRRHLDTVPRMATAVFKMTKINSSEGVSDTVQYFLDRLYINRS